MPRPTLLAPFGIRGFRFQWPADLLTSWAFEMETLILGWFILVETGSVLLLTLFGALQFAGTLVSPLLGVLGDRVGHKVVLCCMRASYAVLATVLMALAFTGRLGALEAFVVTGIAGLVRPSDLAMRSALIADAMPADLLMGAMGVARTTSDSARIAGALAGAGLFAALGIGPAYVAVVACYVAGLLLTLGVGDVPRRVEASARGQIRPSPWRDLVEGLAYVWRTPHMLGGMWIACLVNLTAFPITSGLLPYIARDIYGLDQKGLGWLVASFATGALLGSVVVAWVGGGLRLGRTLLIWTAAWYAALLAFAYAPGVVDGMVLLMLAGYAQSISMIALAVMLLRTADARYRGRVMGVRMLAIYSLPIGLLTAGVLIPRFGFRTTTTLYAVFGLVATLAIAIRWRAHLWHRMARGNDG